MLLHTNNIDIGDISRYFRRFELSMYLYHTVRCDSGKIVGLGLEAQGLGFGVGLVLCSYVALWPCESPQGHMRVAFQLCYFTTRYSTQM